MRSLVLSTVIAASASVLGACGGTAVNNVPVKPPTTPAPIATVSPVSPVSPTTTIDPKAPVVKPTTSPEIKKADDKKAEEKKDDKTVKPVTVETPKK